MSPLKSFGIGRLSPYLLHGLEFKIDTLVLEMSNEMGGVDSSPFGQGIKFFTSSCNLPTTNGG